MGTKASFSVSKIVLFGLFPILSFLQWGCSGDDGDTPPEPTGKSISYPMNKVDDLNIFGQAKFIENQDNSTTVEITLQNTFTGEKHGVVLRRNTGAEGGGIARTLNTMDGTTGKSSTTFSTLDNGQGITYTDLLTFDGYLNVTRTDNVHGEDISQGGIGPNKLTGKSKEYGVTPVGNSPIVGKAIISERVNGTSLIVITLAGTTAQSNPKAYIYEKAIDSLGNIAIDLSDVQGDKGYSATQVEALNNGQGLTYDDLIDFDGHIKIVDSADETLVLAQGNIGVNN
ncbi:MAG: hypothetical protein AB3N16_15310 [Flavobacteriaceae bacterium]